MQTLTDFLKGLYAGNAAVAHELHEFSAYDKETALQQLQYLYERETIEAPGMAPAFNGDAAMWAACFIYKATQLLLIRKLGEEHIAPNLADYNAPATPDVVYSADLTLRYLPPLMNLAEALAPADPLVVHLKAIAAKWPYSSVGCKLEADEAAEKIIFEHPSLSIAYADRIIEYNDKKRAITDKEKELLTTVLGNHAAVLMPGFEPTL